MQWGRGDPKCENYEISVIIRSNFFAFISIIYLVPYFKVSKCKLLPANLRHHLVKLIFYWTDWDSWRQLHPVTEFC